LHTKRASVNTDKDLIVIVLMPLCARIMHVHLHTITLHDTDMGGGGEEGNRNLGTAFESKCQNKLDVL
jgi:hypothetical protein